MLEEEELVSVPRLEMMLVLVLKLVSDLVLLMVFGLADEGIGVQLDVKSGVGVRAGNQTAVVWRVPITGLGDCDSPAMEKHKPRVSVSKPREFLSH